MVAYNAQDPLGWAWIKAEQDAQAAGQNAAGGTRYTTPGFGDDPEWLAYESQYQWGQTQAAADAELRKRQAADAYEQALRSLETQGVQGAQNTDTNLLSRGMFNSGERVTRQEDLRRALGEGRSQADTQYSQQLGGVDSDLQRALTQMDMERERQVVASKARIAEQQRQGSIEAGLYGGGSGSGGGGGSVATDTPPVPGRTPAQQQSAANQQRAVNYSQTYQNPGGGRGSSGATANTRPPRPAVVSTSNPGGGRATPATPRPRNYPQTTRY